jgi:hypothetical protein
VGAEDADSAEATDKWTGRTFGAFNTQDPAKSLVRGCTIPALLAAVKSNPSSGTVDR